jgi:hypothetical protein
MDSGLCLYYRKNHCTAKGKCQWAKFDATGVKRCVLNGVVAKNTDKGRDEKP